MNNGENTKSNAFAAKKKKRLSVERIYQKKTQLEHILLRPDTYIGSVEPIKQNMWVYDAETDAIVSKEITYTPGLYKIFVELLGEQIGFMFFHYLQLSFTLKIRPSASYKLVIIHFDSLTYHYLL